MLNVRLFGLRDDTFMMDTLGLCLFGMLDLQLHFRGLEPQQVAAYLWELAATHLASGPEAKVRTAVLISDGATIIGPDATPATCRYEMAIRAPRRGVIDIEPSSPYSARSS